MKQRGQLVQENLGNIIIMIAVIAVVVIAVLAFKGQLSGLNTANVPLNSIIAACNLASDLEQGKAEYCTLVSTKYTELDGFKQYVSCKYLGETKKLLENEEPVFGACPSSETEKAFCESLKVQRNLERDTRVNGKLCAGTVSWLSISYEEATKKV
jgi:hypothetical protein